MDAICNTAAWVIPLAVITALAGCGTNPGIDDIHHSPNAKSATRTLADSPLRVVAVAESCQSGNQVDRTITLVNESRSDCQIRSIGLTTVNNASDSSRIVRISSNFVPSGAYMFAVVRINRSDQASVPAILIEVEFGDSTGQMLVPLVQTCVSAHSLKLSTDLSTACMYLRVPSDQAFAWDDVAELRVNGDEAMSHDVSVLPERSGTALIGVTFAMPKRPNQDEVVFVDLRLKNGTRFVSSSKAFACWFVGKTQYDSPLRVVNVTEKNDLVKLELYNESDFAKAPIVIDSIRLGGGDVTSVCELPNGPLPPDRHNYQSDVRFLTLKNPWRNQTTQLLEIDFHRIGTPQVAALAAGLNRETIGCYLRRGCDSAIGFEFDPYLPGCISLHNGGLRPHLAASDVVTRMQTIARQSKSVPVYANISTGVDPSEAVEIGAACDIVVVSPKTSIKATGEDAISETVAYYAKFRERGVPFVASVSPDSAAAFSPNDYRWSTLLALCEGSCGCLLRSTADQDTDLARSCLPVVESIKTEWQSLTHTLALSESYLIPAESSQPGIHFGSRVCSRDELILFAINEWCTRAAHQGDEDFYAVPRHGVEIGIRLGADWDVVTAEDAFERTPIPFRRQGDGTIQLSIPRFEIARCIRLRRRVDPTTSERSVVQEIGEREPPLVMPAVAPLKSPFFSLGRQEIGTEQEIRIPVRNSTNAAIKVDVKDVSRRTSNPGITAFASALIPSSADGILTGKIVVPTTARDSVTHLRILTSNAEEIGFDCFVHIEPYNAITCDPEIVDFREFTSVEDLRFQNLTIHSESSDFRIENVESPDLPAEISISSDARSVRFRAKPDSYGGFTGTIKMQISVRGPKNLVRRISVTVPFVGHYLREVASEPERLLVVSSGQRQIRRIKVRRTDGRPSSIMRVQAMASWVRAQNWTTDASAQHTIDIVVLPTELPSRSSTVEIEVATDRDQIRRISVPIKVVGITSQSASNTLVAVVNQDERTKMVVHESNVHSTSAVPTSADVSRKVQTILQRAKINETSPTTPNWAGMHQLLTLGETAYSTGSLETLSVIDSIINPESPRPPFVIRNGKPIERRKGEGELFDHQHHRDQFLHLMSMCGVPRTATLFVNDRQYRVSDLLENSLLESQTNGELAWSVSAYSVYLQPGFQWTNKHGMKFTMGTIVERLLAEEDGACGGTHQLLGLARVFSNHVWKEDSSLRSLWPRIEGKLLGEVKRIAKTQATNGSFDPPADLRKKILAEPNASESRVTVYYTGHCMEWLSTFLSGEQSREAWVLRAVDALSNAVVADYADESALRQARTTEEFYRYGNQTHAISGLSRWNSKAAR